MAFLLYSAGTSVTGKALAQGLGIHAGTKPPAERLGILIRWGSTEKVPLTPRLVLNRASAITLATDKIRSLDALRAQGVAVPETISVNQALTANGLIKLPALGRKRHHTQGQDIILCMQAKDVKRCITRGDSDYFVVYIPTRREYRVHVFNNQIIKVNQKLLKDGNSWVPFIRNIDNGYVFGQPRKPLSSEQGQLAIKAVRAMGLDFGAVDLILADDTKSYVLEVNTGPALETESNLDLYIQAFKRVINGVGELLV